MRRELGSSGVARGERGGVERGEDGSQAAANTAAVSATARSRTIRTRPERDPMLDRD